jgi:large subunit ribosomal protein L13
MKTTKFVTKSDVERRWWVVDAEGKVLGRMASEVASVLRGKRKPSFTPNADTGDFVVVVNAEKIKLTGHKWSDKLYHDHSGYPGGIKSRPAAMLRERKPADLVWRAVKGMLPKGALGNEMIRKLKIYAGPEHPHQAQQPAALELD